MRKISGCVVSTKPITLSRAAKLVSRFAAVDNGSSAAVSLYLQRTADAFNNLVQFHDKRPKIDKSVGKLQIDGVEKGLDGDEGKSSEKRAKNSDVNNLDEMKPEAKDLEIPAKERKKKRKKKSDDAGLEEKSSRKKKSRDDS